MESLLSLMSVVLGKVIDMIASGEIHVTERECVLVCKHKGEPDIDAVDDCPKCAISSWIESLWKHEYTNTLTFLFDLPLIVKHNWRVMLSLDYSDADVNKFIKALLEFLESNEIYAFNSMTLVESVLIRADFRDNIDFPMFWSVCPDFPETLNKVLDIAKSRDEEGYMSQVEIIEKQRAHMLMSVDIYMKSSV